MIDTILHEMYSYVHDIVSRVEDDFDDCEDFEDYIAESVIKNTKENLIMLNKYLDSKQAQYSTEEQINTLLTNYKKKSGLYDTVDLIRSYINNQ